MPRKTSNVILLLIVCIILLIFVASFFSKDGTKNVHTIQKEEHPSLSVAREYMDAYVAGDWERAKELCIDPNFDETLTSGYNFVSYEIVGSEKHPDDNYYHVYIELMDKDGNKYTEFMGIPIEVFMGKDTKGKWRPRTWYFSS